MEDKENDLSQMSIALYSVTGFYSNDYIKPVINNKGNLLKIISDESEFKNHYCSSLIIMPFLSKEYLLQKEKALEALIARMNIPNIHFTDIFGRNNLLGKEKNIFIDEYINI